MNKFIYVLNTQHNNKNIKFLRRIFMSVLLKEKNNLSKSVINQKYQKNEYNNNIEKNENDIVKYDYFPELLDIKND